MESIENIRKLYLKYLDHTITKEENKVLFDFFDLSDPSTIDKYLGDLINDAEPLIRDKFRLQQTSNKVFERISRKIDAEEIEPKIIPIKKNIPSWLYAVAGIAIFTLFFYLYEKNGTLPPDNPVMLSDYGADVAPGINTAYLKTADGKTFNLSEQKEGIIIENAVKTADGEISFTAPIAAHEKVSEIVVPNGGQFQIKLEDGTIVKLNAGSSLKFPNKFNDQQRIVELTGEGFFVVAKNPEKPFFVKSRNQITQVLGTQFNVRTYKDEQETVTTLLEGSVKVNNSYTEKILKPNEQTINSNNLLTVEKVDAANQLGWIRNEFTLDNKTIKEVLTEAGRWYNIEVVFNKEPSNELFSGAISRDTKLSSLLRLLELSDIKFRLTPNKLTVF